MGVHNNNPSHNHSQDHNNNGIGIELHSRSRRPAEEGHVILTTNDAHHHPGHGHHHHIKSETTAWDAWIQLTKAYIGPGCLSLPWAVSQLGLPMGIMVVCIVSFWTSYNCWNVVSLKRIIMRERQQQQQHMTDGSDRNGQADGGGDNPHHGHHHHHHHNYHQVTYPDVGEWAYNHKFKDILLLSICVQQLAVCTVFLSFVGENIAAVLERTLTEEGEKAPSHAFVITLALPAALLLSCLPNLKILSPVMLVATISLFTGFGLLGFVVAEEWDHRPQGDEVDLYTIEWSQVPMAICAVLYSYEGICVILPIESAMAAPEHFQKVFVTSMTFTALVFCSVASLCVIAFGDVTNGSVTAFLVENLQEENVKWWLYMANTACSMAVLLTYPLQLFPCFELTGPWITRMLRLDIGTHMGGGASISRGGDGHHRRSPLRSFSPIPSCDNPDDGIVGNHDYHHADPPSTMTTTTPRSATTTVGGEETETTDNNNAVEDDDSVETTNNFGALPFDSCEDIFPTPGDSPQVRAILVCLTYIMAIAIPNVQLLVSLAGALSGSATGLIIPPLLELAYVKRLEKELPNADASAILSGAFDNGDNDDNDDDDSDNFEDENRNNGDENRGFTSLASPSADRPSLFRLKMKKWECYTLFGLGVVICVFGTGAALADIVRVYMGP